MPAGLVEMARIDRVVGPFLVIAVRRLGGLGAAEILLAAGRLLLGPLEHLDGALKAQQIAAADPEGGIPRRCARRHRNGKVHQFVVISGIDRTRIRLHDLLRALVEGPNRLDGAALVPPQQDDAADHQQDPDDRADKALHNALQPPRRGHFGDAVVRRFFAHRVPADARSISYHSSPGSGHPDRPQCCM
jgi:hypothetical protein